MVLFFALFCFVVSSFGCLLEKRKKMQGGGG